MMDLFTAARSHDLPPKWDGRAVRWRPWEDPPQVFICPPLRERSVCPACGSISRRVMATGLLAHRRKTTVDTIEGYERAHRAGYVAYYSLIAFRCVDCQHDQVWDSRRDELWDLDFTDYGDEGSVHPEGRW